MATAKTNVFTAYEFTEEEELQASVFSELQRMWVQTQVSIVAEEKINIKYNPLAPGENALQEAYARGQVDFGLYLLGLSEDRKSALQKHLEAVAASQTVS